MKQQDETRRTSFFAGSTEAITPKQTHQFCLNIEKLLQNTQFYLALSNWERDQQRETLKTLAKPQPPDHGIAVVFQLIATAIILR